jgi:hypothetical protein
VDSLPSVPYALPAFLFVYGWKSLKYYPAQGSHGPVHRNEHPGRSAAQPNVRIGTSVEIPYANVGDTTVTAENARSFGHDLARALTQYLQSPTRVGAGAE